MIIFFYKELTRIPEIKNTPVWVLSNICSLGQVKDSKFGTDFSNEMLLNPTKHQGYSFYRCELLRENQQGGKRGERKIKLN